MTIFEDQISVELLFWSFPQKTKLGLWS